MAVKIIDEGKIKTSNKESDEHLKKLMQDETVDYIVVKRNSEGIIAIFEVHYIEEDDKLELDQEKGGV